MFPDFCVIKSGTEHKHKIYIILAAGQLFFITIIYFSLNSSMYNLCCKTAIGETLLPVLSPFTDALKLVSFGYFFPGVER